MSRLTRSLSLGSTNALANFGRVVEDIGDRDVLLLLDYDGTLAPIVNDPSQVRPFLVRCCSEWANGITGRGPLRVCRRTCPTRPGTCSPS